MTSRMMRMSSMMSLMKGLMSTTREWLGQPNLVIVDLYQIGSSNLSRQEFQSPAASIAMLQAYLPSTPFTKPFGSHSRRHFSLLQKARHPSRSLIHCSFFGILKPSVLMGFLVQIVGKLSTATKLFLVLADVSVLTKPFGLLGIDIAAEIVY